MSKRRGNSRAGRPRGKGDRYASGDLKPQKVEPNKRVVEIRRELLGVAEGETFDLSKAENALDIALARDWISVDHHMAARQFEMMCRRALTSIPDMKVSADPADRAIATAIGSDGDGTARSGATTYLDDELLLLGTRVEAGALTPAQYARAVKAHRQAKLDWARVPHSVISAIWDAALSQDTLSPADAERVLQPRAVLRHAGPQVRLGPDGRELPEEDESARMLRLIRARLSPDERAVLFGVCVLGSWPQWVILRIRGKEVPPHWDRSRRQLEQALEVVGRVVKDHRRDQRPRSARVLHKNSTGEELRQ